MEHVKRVIGLCILLFIVASIAYAFPGSGNTYSSNSTTMGVRGGTGLDGTSSRFTTTPYQPGNYPADGNTYRANVGWFETDAQTPPTIPVLLIPANDSLIINRTPEFVWDNSDDAQGDALTYDLLVDNDTSFSSPIINNTGIAEETDNTSFSNSSLDLDVDTMYYWKVQAYDGMFYSGYSTTFNFTLESYLAVTLIVNSTDFGTMSPGENNDTTDNNPSPLVTENEGNIVANVTITATKLFDEADFPSEYYQFKIDVNESNSFITGASTMTFTNMTNVSSRVDVVSLDWHNINDTSEIDINLTVPAGESPEQKTSILTITVSP